MKKILVALTIMLSIGAVNAHLLGEPTMRNGKCVIAGTAGNAECTKDMRNKLASEEMTNKIALLALQNRMLFGAGSN